MAMSSRRNNLHIKLTEQLQENYIKSYTLAAEIDKHCIIACKMESKVCERLKLSNLNELNYVVDGQPDNGSLTFVDQTISSAQRLYQSLLHKFDETKKKELVARLETCLKGIIKLLNDRKVKNKIYMFKATYTTLMSFVDFSEHTLLQAYPQLLQLGTALVNLIKEHVTLIGNMTIEGDVAGLTKTHTDFWNAESIHDTKAARAELKTYKKSLIEHRTEFSTEKLIDQYISYYKMKIYFLYEHKQETVAAIKAQYKQSKKRIASDEDILKSVVHSALLKALRHSKNGLKLGRLHSEELINTVKYLMHETLEATRWQDAHFYTEILIDILSDNLNLLSKNTSTTEELKESKRTQMKDAISGLNIIEGQIWSTVIKIFKPEHQNYLNLGISTDNAKMYFLYANDIEKLEALLDKFYISYERLADADNVVQIGFRVDIEAQMKCVYNEYINMQLKKEAEVKSSSSTSALKTPAPKPRAKLSKKEEKKQSRKQAKKTAKATAAAKTNSLMNQRTLQPLQTHIIRFDDKHIYDVTSSTNRIYKLYASYNHNMYICIHPVLEEYLQLNHPNELQDLLRSLEVGIVLCRSVNKKGTIIGNEPFYKELNHAELYAKYKSRNNSRLAGTLTHKVKVNNQLPQNATSRTKPSPGVWCLLFTYEAFIPSHKNTNVITVESLTRSSKP